MISRRKFLAGAIAAAVAPMVGPEVAFEEGLGGYASIIGYERYIPTIAEQQRFAATMRHYAAAYAHSDASKELHDTSLGVDEGPYSD